MKTTQLPNALTIALGQYYLNRQLSREQLVSSTFRHVKDEKGKFNEEKEETYRSGRPWDKKEDLKRIWQAIPSAWTGSAVAGSFWFNTSRLKKSHYYVTEELWPLAEVRTLA